MNNNWPPYHRLANQEEWMNTYPRQQIEQCRMELIHQLAFSRSYIIANLRPQMDVHGRYSAVMPSRPLIVPPGSVLHNTLNQHIYGGAAQGHIQINDNRISNLYPVDLWHRRLEETNSEMEVDRIIERCQKYSDRDRHGDDEDSDSSSNESALRTTDVFGASMSAPTSFRETTSGSNTSSAGTSSAGTSFVGTSSASTSFVGTSSASTSRAPSTHRARVIMPILPYASSSAQKLESGNYSQSSKRTQKKREEEEHYRNFIKRSRWSSDPAN